MITRIEIQHDTQEDFDRFYAWFNSEAEIYFNDHLYHEEGLEPKDGFKSLTVNGTVVFLKSLKKIKDMYEET